MQIPSETIQELLPQPSQRVLSLTARSLKDERGNDDFNVLLAGGTCELRQIGTGRRIDEDAIGKGKAIQLGKNIEVNGRSNMLLEQRESLNRSFGHIKREQMALHMGQVGNAHFSNQDQAHIASSQVSHRDDCKDLMTDNVICESLTQACLSISLGNSNQSAMLEPTLNEGTHHTALLPSGAVEDGRDQNKTISSFQQAQRAHHLLPRTHKTGQTVASEASKEVHSHMRVARPPTEGRGRNQLLPRYWPRITDQELQQISGEYPHQVQI